MGQRIGLKARDWKEKRERGMKTMDARRMTRRRQERVRGTRRDEGEHYEDNEDAMPGTLRPGLTRGNERARESEVIKSRRKREEPALLKDARRYDSDSSGSSANWRARESLEGEEVDVI